jgi:putative membrane protein
MIKTFLLGALAAGLAVLAASKLFSGVRAKKTGTAVTVALVFALLNLVIGWLITAVLAVVLLPAALLTFGLPYLLLGWIANVILLWITDALVADFEIEGFGALLGTGALVSVAAWLVQRLV